MVSGQRSSCSYSVPLTLSSLRREIDSLGTMSSIYGLLSFKTSSKWQARSSMENSVQVNDRLKFRVHLGMTN